MRLCFQEGFRCFFLFEQVILHISIGQHLPGHELHRKPALLPCQRFVIVKGRTFSWWEMKCDIFHRIHSHPFLVQCFHCRRTGDGRRAIGMFLHPQARRKNLSRLKPLFFKIPRRDFFPAYRFEPTIVVIENRITGREAAFFQKEIAPHRMACCKTGMQRFRIGSRFQSQPAGLGGSQRKQLRRIFQGQFFPSSDGSGRSDRPQRGSGMPALFLMGRVNQLSQQPFHF